MNFSQIMAKMELNRLARIERAGKHKCVKMLAGCARRVTGKNGKILKRPVIIMKFYECSKCGRTMK